MIESSVNGKRRCRSTSSCTSKRLKYYVDNRSVDSSSNTETDSNLSTSDIEYDDDQWNLSTDQQISQSVSHSSLNSYAQGVIKQFHQLSQQTTRKTQQLTRSENVNESKEKISWILKTTFNRSDLLHEGYAVLSDQSFPFYSLCYLCGSMGMDLIYCNQCSQAYHSYCLNASERPRFRPVPDSWLCPMCYSCQICGLSSTDCSLSISCSDCQRIFHRTCLKSSLSDSIVHLSRWLCPSCIQCDCGQRLKSTDDNLLQLGKSVTCQQSLMCTDCSNRLKDLRTKSNIKLEKCHLCQRYLSQYLTKMKPLFSLSLISQQSKQKQVPLFQCQSCQHHFHPHCDGYLTEDVLLQNSFKVKIICSQCDREEKEKNQNLFQNYKLEIVQNTIRDLTSILVIMISNETRFLHLQRSLSNLEQLHQSLNQSLNLHAYLNDLIILIQEYLSHLPTTQWQAAIETCLSRHCPWFQWKSSLLTNTTLISSSIESCPSTSSSIHSCIPWPSIDHSYAVTGEHLRSKFVRYQMNLLTSKNSLLKYLDESSSSSWSNLHQIDTRQCQLCHNYSDQCWSNLSRLVPIGLNQWIHLNCLLPIYVKSHPQSSPMILTNIHSMIEQCQMKFSCDLCSKFNATIQCFVKNCSTRFHSSCLEQYYSKHAGHSQICRGLLPNLMTLCPKHSDYSSSDRFIHLSTPIHVDLSNTSIDVALTDLQLCIGSLQIHSLGHFDYLINEDLSELFYPADYHASRVYWSTKNAREKTVYHLKIEIKQNYHHETNNHRTIVHPLSDEEIHREKLYEQCRMYFQRFQRKKSMMMMEKLNVSRQQTCPANEQSKSSDHIAEILSIDTKTLRNLFTPDSMKSSHLSHIARALVQALQRIDQSLPSIPNEPQTPIFSYYPIPQMDGSADCSPPLTCDQLIQLYLEWTRSKFGHVRFYITSDDGYSIDSDNLDDAWSMIINEIRSCRDEMNLTHLAMNEDQINGHHVFGLTKSIVKHLFQRLYLQRLSLIDDQQSNVLPLFSSNSSRHWLKKKFRKNCKVQSSRLIIYQRKQHHHRRRQPFAWLTNPHRTIQPALDTFELDETLLFVRQILLQEASVTLRLYHLPYFSQRVLFVGASAIDGCGLFTLIDLVEGQMIIEYTGDVIRQSLTDQRERENEKKGVGCYMFTVDSNNVIDATYQGNKARFINHHCQPNCFAKTVQCAGKKHIVIYADMDIERGSELTYDYSFQEEDIKIPCRCGTSQCRIYLN